MKANSLSTYQRRSNFRTLTNQEPSRTKLPTCLWIKFNHLRTYQRSQFLTDQPSHQPITQSNHLCSNIVDSNRNPTSQGTTLSSSTWSWQTTKYWNLQAKYHLVYLSSICMRHYQGIYSGNTLMKLRSLILTSITTMMSPYQVNTPTPLTLYIEFLKDPHDRT
jgi:hypothetical protein